MSEFINVPVPKEHVNAVYRLLASLGEGLDQEDSEELEFEEWTAQDLKKLSDSPQASVKRVALAMDELAKKPDVPMALSELATHLGLSRLELRGAFSGFSRWINTTWPHDNSWPIAFTFGPAVADDVATETFYSLPETSASRWKQIRKTK